jgi:hypothetical protein
MSRSTWRLGGKTLPTPIKEKITCLSFATGAPFLSSFEVSAIIALPGSGAAKWTEGSTGQLTFGK